MFNIIPQPVSILINQSKKGFTLHTGTTISPYSFTEDLIKFSKKQFGKKIIMHEDTGEERSIILKLDDSIEHEEGYTIKCENRRVFINAKTESGLFYGLQTLKQMLLQTEGKIPYVEITDFPRFAYRGYMLDCGRCFYTVDEVKRIVDLMSLHKLNVLHLCNGDNYYTQEDLKEFVTYCQAQKIKVITEKENSKRINSSEKQYRFDYPYGLNTLKNICDDDGALTDSREETLGIEGKMWTEYAPNMKRFEFLTFPRLGAMAENAWAEKGFPSFSTFIHKAPDYYKLLDFYDVQYAPLKKACPSFIYKYASSLWYKRHNLFGKKKI